MDVGDDNQLTKKRLCKDTSAEAAHYRDRYGPRNVLLLFENVRGSKNHRLINNPEISTPQDHRICETESKGANPRRIKNEAFSRDEDE